MFFIHFYSRINDLKRFLFVLLGLLLALTACSGAPEPHSTVVECNFGPNPIWDGIFANGNQAQLINAQLQQWRNLDGMRLNVSNDAQLVSYVNAVIRQLTESPANTPFGVVGKWLLENTGSVEIVDQLGNENANAGFQFDENGNLVITLKRAYAVNSYALTLAISLSHEFTHAAYQRINDDQHGLGTFCAEYQAYSVAVAAYHSVRHAFRDDNYELWYQDAQGNNWWYSDRWVDAIEAHLAETYH